MHFYRRFYPIQAISFDLDDTLYDNRPVLQQAEMRLLAWLAQLGSEPCLGDALWWQQLKAQLILQQPLLQHDVSGLRRAVLETGLTQLAVAAPQKRADQAMLQFMQWRNQIKISASTTALLTDLSKHYLLLAITNGNADPALFAPTLPFTAIYRAGIDGLAKPEPDLFQAALTAHQLQPRQLLHIGDHRISDICGAARLGIQTGWLNPRAGGHHCTLPQILPTFSFSQLHVLRHLI